ncbi:MAG TPA: serine hydrolase [Flavisolibacter sp.]|nr:serine hydrolase [Flavisolibacter sp.]
MDFKKHRSTTAYSPKSDELLADLLRSYPHYFDSLLVNNDTWQIQVIYTQINRDRQNKPSFKHLYYNVNSSQYFYPASTVKLPAAILSLQKLNELKIKGLDKNTTMITDSGFEGQTSVYNDPTSADGRPTIAHYIKKILLVSDNDAYNRLYEFLGQEYINNCLSKMGYDSVEIIHRLSLPLTEEQNRYTNPIRFVDTSSNTIYQQPLLRSSLTHHQRNNKMGMGFYSNNKLITAPFDFSKKNRLALTDLHSILQSVIFPGAMNKKQRFNLKEEDYQFLYTYMSMYPGESIHPSYDNAHNDAYVKFLLYGAKDPVRPNIRIFNKVGDAYGFLIDAAYVVDFDNKIEFLLSAVIHCNPDGIYNDDKYEYEKVGFPFMKHLGEVIYEYEKTRKRKYLPDLSIFKMNYGQ